MPGSPSKTPIRRSCSWLTNLRPSSSDRSRRPRPGLEFILDPEVLTPRQTGPFAAQVPATAPGTRPAAAQLTRLGRVLYLRACVPARELT